MGLVLVDVRDVPHCMQRLLFRSVAAFRAAADRGSLQLGVPVDSCDAPLRAMLESVPTEAVAIGPVRTILAREGALEPPGMCVREVAHDEETCRHAVQYLEDGATLPLCVVLTDLTHTAQPEGGGGEVADRAQCEFERLSQHHARRCATLEEATKDARGRAERLGERLQAIFDAADRRRWGVVLCASRVRALERRCGHDRPFGACVSTFVCVCPPRGARVAAAPAHTPLSEHVRAAHRELLKLPAAAEPPPTPTTRRIDPAALQHAQLIGERATELRALWLRAVVPREDRQGSAALVVEFGARELALANARCSAREWEAGNEAWRLSRLSEASSWAVPLVHVRAYDLQEDPLEAHPIACVEAAPGAGGVLWRAAERTWGGVRLPIRFARADWLCAAMPPDHVRSGETEPLAWLPAYVIASLPAPEGVRTVLVHREDPATALPVLSGVRMARASAPIHGDWVATGEQRTFLRGDVVVHAVVVTRSGRGRARAPPRRR